MIAIGLASTMLTLAITAQKADAAATRAEYVAQVDAICLAAEQQALQQIKRETKRYASLLRKVLPGEKATNPRGAFERAFARVFAKIAAPSSKRLGQTTAQIAAIPPAPGDEAIVSAWIEGQVQFKALYDRAIRAARHAKFSRMLTLTKQAVLAGVTGDAAVEGFGFQHCVQPVPQTSYDGTS